MKLDTPVSELRGCGPRKAQALRQLGIETVKDLHGHYPTRVKFAPVPTSLSGVVLGDTITVVGKVSRTADGWDGRQFPCTILNTFGEAVPIIWFNSWSQLRRLIHKGVRIMATGVLNVHGHLVNPEFRTLPIEGEPNLADLRVVIYPVTSGITSKDIGRFVKQTLHLADDTVRSLHNPKNQAEYNVAVQHEKYRELFYMQLALAVRKQRRESEPTNVRCVPMMRDPERYFPFDFTPDQLGATRQVLIDMCQHGSMNRLLQGDVGSGKTAVAAYAAMLMACNRGQTAILCPTQVLAEQHYRSIKGFFDAAGLRCVLLSGCTTTYVGPDTDHPRLDIADVVVGTTALLSTGIMFHKLGLVVVDEEHRFGAAQRAALRKHGNPHQLKMSATPIPRTIAMTAFGDLDVSVIKTMPPGRLPVETCWVPGPASQAYADMDFTIEGELARGHQVYVVCPRIEALDDEMRAVEEVAEEYRERYPGAVVGVLHGKMAASHKLAVQGWWSRARQLPGTSGKILVATTVVEVGIDNPNATVMVVEGAERFGLATLHQLRGRVGRSDKKSYCFLLSDTESAEGRARLKAMERTNDGFEIAEIDLGIRGPGDLLSTHQHGLPDLKLADLVVDYELMLDARSAAATVMYLDADDPVRIANLSELKSRYSTGLSLSELD